MSILRSSPRKISEARVSVNHNQLVDHNFSVVRNYLTDTQNVLPHSFTGASVDYPSERLRQGDILDVHLSALIVREFPVHVTDLVDTPEGMSATLLVEEPDFAIASLLVAVCPDRRKPRDRTFVQGTMDIHEYSAPIPACMIRPVASRAIKSFINSTLQNIETQSS